MYSLNLFLTRVVSALQQCEGHQLCAGGNSVRRGQGSQGGVPRKACSAPNEDAFWREAVVLPQGQEPNKPCQGQQPTNTSRNDCSLEPGKKIHRSLHMSFKVIFLIVSFFLLTTLFALYFQIRASIRTINPKEKKYMQSETKLKRQVFHKNVMRLKSLITCVIDFGKYLS